MFLAQNPILSILLISILLLLWVLKDQRVYRRQLRFSNGSSINIPFFNETTVVKFIKFLLPFLGVVFSAYSALPVIEGYQTRKMINSNINSDNNDINNQFEVSGTNLLIKTDIYAEPDYFITLSGFEVGGYELSRSSTCVQDLISTIKNIDESILPLVDSNAQLIIKIIGQADGIKLKKNAVYQGKDDIPPMNYKNIDSEKSVLKRYKSKETKVVNEDFGRIRAFTTYQLFDQNLKYPFRSFELYSSETAIKGANERKVEVLLYMPSAFKEKMKHYNTFQKKVFEFVVNL